MHQVPLPSTKAVRDLLSDLLGREVDLAPIDVIDPVLDHRSAVGVYHDEARNTAAVVTADLALSAYLAAALALLNKEAADEVAADAALPESYLENLHEILNIVGTLFNAESPRPVRLADMHGPGQQVPPRVADLAIARGRRLDVTVSIPGYGSGHMALVGS
jgi:hypothetical protein